MWDSIKRFFARLNEELGEASQYILTGTVVIILVIASIFIAQQWTKNASKPDMNPELTQRPNPSIGEALPPDVNIEIVDNPDKDKSITQSTSEQNDQTVTVADSGEVKSADTQTYFISPPTGLDPNKPVAYYNTDLGFKLTLPPGSTVQEQNNTVNMYSESGKLLASIIVVKTTESLADIKAQLNLSSEVSALTDAKLANQAALKYNVQQQTGYALKNSDRLYYLTGQSNILSQFSL